MLVLDNGKGKPFPINSITVEDSFTLYCTKFTINTNLPLELGIWHLSGDGISDSEEYSLFCVATAQVDSGYTSEFVPYGWWELSGKVFAPVKGRYTTEELLSYYGIKHTIDYKTIKEYIELPSMRIFDLIDALKDIISVMNGGGTVLTFSMDSLRVCDLKLASERQAQVSLSGVNVKDRVNVQWSQFIPGSVALTQDFINKSTTQNLMWEADMGNITREVSKKQMFAAGKYTEFVSNTELGYLTERAGRNQFYRAYCQRMLYDFRVTEPCNLQLGDTVDVKDYGNISLGVVVAINTNSQNTVYTVAGTGPRKLSV